MKLVNPYRSPDGWFTKHPISNMLIHFLFGYFLASKLIIWLFL